MKYKILLKTIISLFILAVLFIPNLVHGQPKPPPTIGGITSLPFSRFSSTQELVVGIINLLLELAAGFVIFAIIYSGIMYITAGGDTTKAEAARKNITWAIIGIIVISLSLVIVNFAIRIVTTNP